jgi:transaldolase
MAIKIFADGADLASIIELNKNPLIQGFTTNPSLLRKSGVTNYKEFASQVLEIVKDKPVSFEVIADDYWNMYVQAKKIASWGKNVCVKIPITDTKGKYNFDLIEALTCDNIRLNITAITTHKQIDDLFPISKWFAGDYVSIFAGRIADTGVDPIDLISYCKVTFAEMPVEIIWASPREVYNIYQAEQIGCDIITCTPELISKYEKLKGKDLTEYSRETVQMFFRDSIESGLTL